MAKPGASAGRGRASPSLLTAAPMHRAPSPTPIHDFHALPLQAKLEVTPSGDRFEAEADRVADHVMQRDAARRPPPLISALSGGAIAPSLQHESTQRRAPQRQSAQRQATQRAGGKAAATGGKSAAQRSEPKLEEEQRKKAGGPKKAASAQRDASTSDGGFAVPVGAESAIQSMRASGGSPMNAGVRQFMEGRMGHDLSDVRVHDSPGAHRAAEGLGARAFTVGRDVFFGAGQYTPSTPSGQRLLAHELTHTVQQSGGSNTVHAKRLQRNSGSGTTTPGTSGASTGSSPPGGPSGSAVASAGGPATSATFGATGAIELGGQSNGRAGLLTVPTFPVVQIDGINKGGRWSPRNRDAEPAPNMHRIHPTGTEREYLYLGAPHGRRTEEGSGLYAYQLWDRDAPQRLGPRLRAAIPEQIRNKENAADVESSGEPFYYLVRHHINSFRNTRELFLGTADELSRNTRMLRPNWRMGSQGNGGPADLDPDHAHELQFGGADSFDNLWLLDSQANRKAGRMANTHVDGLLRTLLNTVRGSSFWSEYQAANPTATLPASGREARDLWNIRFQRYHIIEPGGHEHYYTQTDIANGLQAEQLKALSEEDLVAAGLRPPPGSTVNFINLFVRQGGGRRYVLTTNDSGNWIVRNGNLNRLIDGYAISHVELNTERAGVGTTLGTVFGTPFTQQQRSGVFVVGPNPPSLEIVQADPLGYSAYINPRRITPNRDSFRINGLSPVLFDEHGVSVEGEYYAKGEIEATKFLFPGLRIGIMAQGDAVYARVPVPTESLNFGPVAVTDAALDVGYEDGVFLRGWADVTVDGVGSGHLEAKASRQGPRIEGDFNFDTDFLDPATARFVYDMPTDELSLTLNAGVQKGRIPGIERGEVTATIDKQGVDVAGTLYPSGFLSGAEIVVAYTRESGITIELNDYRPPVSDIPAIRDAVVSLGVTKPPDAEEWRFYGTGSASFALPYVTGGLMITVDNGVITIIGTGRVERAPASGTLNVTVTNQAIDEEGNPVEGALLDDFRVFGRGSASLSFGIITATAGLELTEDGDIIVDGELALPPSYEVFPERRYERELLHVEPPEFPIWGVSVAGFGFGIFAFFDAYLNFDAFVGPGTLNDVALEASYTFGRPEDTVIDGSANFNIPAGAGFTVDIGGGVRARAATAQVSGRIGLAARLGLEANAGADVGVHWTPEEGLSLSAEAYANVSPKFRVSANARITASVDLLLAEPSYTWGPWEQVLGEFGPDMTVEARFPVEWSEQDGLDLDLDDITIKKPEVDYANLMKDAFLELV